LSADPGRPSGARSIGQAEGTTAGTPDAPPTGGAHSLGQAEERSRAAATPSPPGPSELGAAVQEVTQKASLLVREEIALARAELTQKATRLGKGAAVAAVAGLIALGGVILLLHMLGWFFAWVIGEANLVFLGFLIAAVILFVLAGIAGLIGMRMIKKGTPPKPEMAIEEAKLIRETVQSS
jgi:hypothetical protein